MHDLSLFLTARLDEDEQTARAATPGPWSYDPGKEWYDGDDFVTMTNGQEFVGYGGLSDLRGAVCITGEAGHAQSARDAEHIARHDPARALREVEAKRRTLARHPGSTATDECSGCGARLDGTWRTPPGALCPELADLALPYAGHEEYREDWRP
ncbi:DUF6221 family protein [Nonomuraea sp. NPDC050536]|uniref:DUF6221 family protein n=1 Tax=Nonomuraea sp. NPDC050536 TaxID=3364366 RepID=UPI0037C53816